MLIVVYMNLCEKSTPLSRRSASIALISRCDRTEKLHFLRDFFFFSLFRTDNVVLYHLVCDIKGV